MHTKEDSQHVGKLLRRLGKLNDEDVEEVLAVGTVESFARGAKMIECGAPLTSAGLVLEGVFAEQVLTSEGRITVSFSVEGDFVGPIADLLAKKTHASQDIVALAPGRIVNVDWPGYLELIERNHAWTRFHSTVMERLLILKSERERQLLAFDAAERLTWFEGRFAAAARLLPLKEVASFLGITPVYLSRLRRRRVLARRAKAT
jgi:CRP-like cAMP-binding protein